MVKALIHHRTGAPLAAATTSLPEQRGGRRNYDYRFCWMRDASFAVDALLTVGLVEDAHGAIVALLGMARRTQPDLVPLYTVLGRVPTNEYEVPYEGYRGARPVRSGNDATDQLQLGIWGDLLDALWRYVERGNDLDPSSGALIAELVDRLCDRWRERDSGIWELQQHEHHTHSKIGAWTALDRALRLAEAGQIDGDTGRWSDEQQTVRAYVEDRCWSDRLESFTFAAGDDRLDAACLLVGRLGFASEAQLAGTVAAVQSELADGAFVWRYSGMRDREGAFMACSFWLVDALARLDRLDEARWVLRTAAGAANELGVFSEEYDPRTGEALGNVPQGLSHLSMINAVAVLEDRQGRRALDLDDRLA
jgi:GH15 family glucan-1,4-alpha-glucosidase